MAETFTEQNLAHAQFNNVNLAHVLFENANLAHAQFNNVNLFQAVIHDANLQDLVIEDANIKGLTIFGMRIDLLLAAEWERRDPQRASLRIQDVSNIEEIRTVFTRVDKLRTSFITKIRTIPADLLTKRSETGGWSALENVQHMLFVEEFYLYSWLLGQNDIAYSPFGLLPDHMKKDGAFAGVGTQLAPDLETVLSAWQVVHDQLGVFLATLTPDLLQQDIHAHGGPDTVVEVLQELAFHTLQHIREIDTLLSALQAA